jgi:hypothetical protein
MRKKGGPLILNLCRRTTEKQFILFDAEPFCFGPISTLLNIVKEMRNTPSLADLDFVLLGTLTSKQLAETANLFERIVDCDTTQIGDLQQCSDYFKSASLFISNTNVRSVYFAKAIGVCPVVYIDTLFWMWDRLHITSKDADLYIIQDFLGVNANLDRWKSLMPAHKVIGPLINGSIKDIVKASSDLGSRRRIMINFGGIESVHFKTNPFVDKFMAMLFANNTGVLGKYSFEFVIAGGGSTISRMNEQYSQHPQIDRIGTLSQDEFVDELARADKVIMLPGLTSFYEAVFLEKDAFFLPPQNYSQLLQLQLYKKHVADGFQGYLWPSVPGENEYDSILDRPLPEMDGVKVVQEKVQAFLCNETWQRELKRQTEIFLSAPATPLPQRLLFGHKQCGSKDAANIIEEVWLSIGKRR